MTKREQAHARRAAFHDARYRVYAHGAITTFESPEAAITFAEAAEGTAYAGTASDMAAGTASEIYPGGVAI